MTTLTKREVKHNIPHQGIVINLIRFLDGIELLFKKKRP